MNERTDLQKRTDQEGQDGESEARAHAFAPTGRGEAVPSGRPASSAVPPAPEGDHTAPLLSSDQAKGLRLRWDAVQVGFVDEPRRSVEQANQLVGDAIRQLAEGFAAERQSRENKWGQGDNAVSTEDLRLALRRYRAFFDRLLCV